MKFEDSIGTNLIKEIIIDKEHHIYSDPDLNFKAGIYEDDSIKMLAITAIDNKYNKINPDYYEIKFNCNWIDEEKCQWLAKVLASDLAETIIKSRNRQIKHINDSIKKTFNLLNINI